MTTTKRPAFQVYPKDYLTDEKVNLMSLEQEGAYWRLMLHQWLEGSIPDDVPALARLCRVGAPKMRRLWPGLAPCFPPVLGQPGRLANRRMERGREEQDAFHERMAAAGRSGGLAKAKREASHTVAVPAIAKLKPSSPSASAVTDKRTETNLPTPPAPADQEPPPTTATPEEATAKAVAVIGPRPWNQRAADTFQRRYGGTVPGARITKALRPLVLKHGEEPVLAAFARYVDETEAEYVSAERFAATFGHWAGTRARAAPVAPSKGTLWDKQQAENESFRRSRGGE